MQKWLIENSSDTITIEQNGGSGIGTSTLIVDGDKRKIPQTIDTGDDLLTIKFI